MGLEAYGASYAARVSRGRVHDYWTGLTIDPRPGERRNRFQDSAGHFLEIHPLQPQERESLCSCYLDCYVSFVVHVVVYVYVYYRTKAY